MKGMKTFTKPHVYFLIFGLVISCTPSVKSDDEQSLKIAIDQFNEAFKNGDTTILEGMITPNYVHTNGSWKSFGKEQWLDYMRSRKERLTNGDLVIENYLMDELAIEFHDRTAIVTAKITSVSRDKGTLLERSFRVTNLWVKHENSWLRAAFHDTEI